jgi:hypothetical protein
VKPQPDGLLTFTAYARRIGVSQQYVSKLVAQGKLPTTAERLIDPAVADLALRGTRDPAMQPVVDANAARRAAGRPGHMTGGGAGAGARGGAGIPPAAPPVAVLPTIASATAADREASAQLKRLRLDREAGRLCEVERVIAAAGDVFASVRAAVEPLPYRLGPMLVGLDERRAITVLEGEFARILSDLADAVEALPESLYFGTRQ